MNPDESSAAPVPSSPISRRTVIGAGVSGLSAATGLAQAQANTAIRPIRIGSRLALTGP